MDDVHVRNLDQIHEDEHRRTARGWSWALVLLGGASLVFAGYTLAGRKADSSAPKVDALGELVAERAKAQKGGVSAAPRSLDLTAGDVTFPSILSDGDKPTTAMAAVRVAPLAHSAAAPATAPSEPPPPTDRLPVVALPAQHVLSATPVVTRPRDALTQAASDSAQLATPAAASAPAGHDGGYQLQVSSFRDQKEASAFSEQLRARGHKSYVVEAKVAGRGTWYRVRVGPFSSQHAAAAYRTSFEAKEHVVPFVVPPEGAVTVH